MLRAVRDYLARLVRARHFLFHLVGAELRGRFRRTAIGILWAMIQPTLMAVMITIVLRHVFDVETVRLGAYVFLGFIMWAFVSETVLLGSDAFLKAEGYIKQVRQPLAIYPLKSVLHALIVFFCGFCGFTALALFFDPTLFAWSWFYVLVFLVLLLLFCAPLAIISAFANVRYRDYQQGIGILLQLFWYASPVMMMRDIYDAPALATFTRYNPFTALLDMLRDPILNHSAPEAHDVLLVLGAACLLWLVAAWQIRRHEKRIVFYF